MKEKEEEKIKKLMVGIVCILKVCDLSFQWLLSDLCTVFWWV